MIPLKTIRTIVYAVPDLSIGIAAWSKIAGSPVYQNNDFATFVGKDGIDIRLSRLPWADYPVVFWEVEDIEKAYTDMLEVGATPMSEGKDGRLEEIEKSTLGSDPKTNIFTKPGRKLAIFKLADGNLMGLLQDL